MITLKTKTQVVYDSVSQDIDFVYFRLSTVTFNGESYLANGVYFTKQDKSLLSDGTQMVEVNIQGSKSSFTVAEADYLENALGITGTTVSERYLDLITKATIHNMNQSGAFGLNGDDWDVVTE